MNIYRYSIIIYSCFVGRNWSITEYSGQCWQLCLWHKQWPLGYSTQSNTVTQTSRQETYWSLWTGLLYETPVILLVTVLNVHKNNICPIFVQIGCFGINRAERTWSSKVFITTNRSYDCDEAAWTWKIHTPRYSKLF